MKRWLVLMAAFLLLTGCATGKQAPDGDGSSGSDPQISQKQPGDDASVWSAEETPVALRYDRMWEYSAYAETEDPAVIGAIVDALRALEVGESTEMAVEDYTDILTFTFPDGTSTRLEFEEQNWVKNEHERYHTEGLPRLRGLLDDLLGEDALY